MKPFLHVSGLSVDYVAASREVVPALRNLHLEVSSGETVGILGESGSGKSSLALALLRLLPANAAITSGDVRYRDHDLLHIAADELRTIRGGEISLIFQEPALALNPVLPVGMQISDVLRAHRRNGNIQHRDETHSILREVGFDQPDRIASAYPHQLSGGQRQRVAIAQALVCRPSLLIADEPLSSLDTVTQAEVLGLLQKLREDLGLSILFITHDAGVLSSFAGRIAVMRKGEIVAQGDFHELCQTADVYVQELISPARMVSPAIPESTVQATHVPLLQVRNLSKRYTQTRIFSRKIKVQALEQVELSLSEQTIVALVGRSGSGKSTLARCIAGFEAPDSGEILLHGTPVQKMDKGSRQQVQLVFQDATTSLNPRFTAGQLIAEPLEIANWGRASERRERVLNLLKEVGLDSSVSNRLAAQFSGGQRQRLALARALALQPKLLILDEAFSGLDVPLQAQMVRLLLELQARHRLTYLYISHDLKFVSLFAQRVIVMQQGRIVEVATPQKLQESQHPETRALLEASQKLHTPGLQQVTP